MPSMRPEFRAVILSEDTRLYYVAKMFTPARRIPLLGFRSVVRLSPPLDWGV
jgi:hypothetical protein